MSSIQTHHINGHDYDYEHTYENGSVVCRRCKNGRTDGRRARSFSFHAATRFANSPYSNYESQEDLDTHIRKAYAAGYGIKRIQGIFGEIDLHPTRRQTENYLRDMGITLRTKAEATPKILTVKEILTTEAREAYTAAQRGLESQRVDDELSSKEQQIVEMKTAAQKDEKEIMRLRVALIRYRDKGRAPTDSEIEELLL